MQCIIGFILAAGSLLMPESPRYALSPLPLTIHTNPNFGFRFRWLVDTGNYAQGMSVIVDLHGAPGSQNGCASLCRRVACTDG